MTSELSTLLTERQTKALIQLIQAHSRVEIAQSNLCREREAYGEACRNLTRVLFREGEVSAALPETLAVDNLDYCWLVTVDIEGGHHHTVKMLGGLASL